MITAAKLEVYMIVRLCHKADYSVLYLTGVTDVLWWAFTHFRYTVCEVLILPAAGGPLRAVTRNASIDGVKMTMSTLITFSSSIALLNVCWDDISYMYK